MLKNHRLFHSNIGTYRDLLVQMRPVFVDIRPQNLRSRVFGSHKVFSYTHVMAKYEYSTFSHF